MSGFITILSDLPKLGQGQINIDASNAGVSAGGGQLPRANQTLTSGQRALPPRS